MKPAQEMKFEIADSIVCTEISGAFNLSNAKAFFQKVLYYTRDHGFSKILIDARGLEGDVSTMERYDIGEFLSEILPATIRTAFIGSTEAV